MSEHDHDHGHGGHGHSHAHGGSCSDDAPKQTSTAAMIPQLSVVKATAGDFDLLKRYIEQDRIDVNLKDNDDVSSLHWAAFKGHFQIVKYLCDYGAEIDAPSRTEWHTPLMWACISGHIKVVNYLLEQGADVKKVDIRGYNALHHAVQYNQTVICHFLLGKGLFIDGRDNEGHTPLMWAAYTNNEDTLRYLVDKGSDVNAVDNTGCTALHWACTRGNMKVVKSLIEYAKANQNIEDKEGATPSQVADKKQFFNITKYLRQSSNSSKPSNLQEKHLIILWFLVTLIGIPCSFFLLVNTRFLIAITLIMIGSYVLKNGLGNYWLDANHRNPVSAGLVFGGYFVSVYSYFTNVLYVTNGNVVETIIFVVTNSMFFPLYTKLLFSDPGVITGDKKGKKGGSNGDSNDSDNDNGEWKKYLETLERDEAIPSFCLTCMVRKPIRAKHCRSCNRCVAKFDHHCGWINNCVGAKNHVSFMACLILVVVNHILFIHLCMTTLGSLQAAPNFLPMNYSIPFYYENEPLVTALIVFHLLNAFWQLWLLYSLVGTIRNNITTNEMINSSRYAYLRNPETGRFQNPFNKGGWNNFKEFLFPTIDWYHLFHLSKHVYQV